MSEQDDMQDVETDEVADEQNPAQEVEESPEDDRDEAWDPERARRKIAKVNSENRTLRERATKAASSVDELSAANLRLEVGYELGLPLAIAKRLQGSTREEMLTDAETLVDLVAGKRPPATQRPAERLRGGGEPDEAPEPDLSKIAADIPRR